MTKPKKWIEAMSTSIQWDQVDELKNLFVGKAVTA